MRNKYLGIFSTRNQSIKSSMTKDSSAKDCLLAFTFIIPLSTHTYKMSMEKIFSDRRMVALVTFPACKSVCINPKLKLQGDCPLPPQLLHQTTFYTCERNTFKRSTRKDSFTKEIDLRNPSLAYITKEKPFWEIGH